MSRMIRGLDLREIALRVAEFPCTRRRYRSGNQGKNTSTSGIVLQ